MAHFSMDPGRKGLRRQLELLWQRIEALQTGGVGGEGTQGPAGPKGDKGDPGETGPAGPMGPAGAAGQAGTTGATGLKGDTGNTGPQGLKGDSGDIGPQGEQGPIGLTGPKGDTGDRGETGLQGAQGPQGAQGVGAAGPTGPAGPAGADSVVPGPAGSTGAQGPIGPQGPVGAKGDTGSQGVKGDTGLTGQTGSQGIQGPTGPTGPAGASADPWTKIGLANDFPNSTVTFNTITGWTFTPPANANWVLEADVLVQTAGTASVPRLGLNVIAGQAYGSGEIEFPTGAAAKASASGWWTTGAANVQMPAGTAPVQAQPYWVRLRASGRSGASPTAVNVQLAAEVAATAASVRPGSEMRWRTV